MAAVEHVVLRLAAPREPTHAAELPERVEALETPRQELVRIGLVTGVPDDLVAGTLEQAMQGDGQLHDAERRSQVAAGVRHGRDDRLADLPGELRQLSRRHPAQVGGALEVRKDGHGQDGSCCWWLGESTAGRRPGRLTAGRRAS